jgi:hypothetical protein
MTGSHKDEAALARHEGDHQGLMRVDRIFGRRPERTVRRVTNPWARKNPALSIWLSWANAVIGAARARATAEMSRQATALMLEGTRQFTRIWTATLTPQLGKKKKRGRHRS